VEYVASIIDIMKNNRFKKNIGAVIYGMIISIGVSSITSSIAVRFTIYGDILKLHIFVKEGIIQENIHGSEEEIEKKLKQMWLFRNIFLLPFTSVITGFAVGLMSASKPWLCGMIAIAPFLFIVPLSPYLSSIEKLFYLCSIFSISSFVSYITFKTKIWYSNKKLEKEENYNE